MPKCIIEGEVNDVGYDGSDHLNAVRRSDMQEIDLPLDGGVMSPVQWSPSVTFLISLHLCLSSPV